MGDMVTAMLRSEPASEVSILTSVDRWRVEAGFLPIDVDPPRSLTELEIQTELNVHELEMVRQGWKPLVHRGTLVWTTTAAAATAAK